MYACTTSVNSMNTSSTTRVLSLILMNVALAQAQAGRSSNRSRIPAGLWAAIGIGALVFIVAAVTLQMALWYPNGCLANVIVALRLPCLSFPILQRRAQVRNRADPVEGIPLATAPPGVAIGHALPAQAVAVPA